MSTLIHAEGRVLAAVDASVYAGSVTAHAAWAAQRLAAPLELLHVLERGSAAPLDLSGSLDLGAREQLLERLATLDEERGRLSQEHGRLLLAQMQAQAKSAQGVAAAVRQRHGSLVDALLDLEDGIRLFVLGKRGEHADFDKGHLGGNLERVMRAVHRPVLVAARAFRPIERFLIAFDGSATTRKCVEMVVQSPLLKGLACHLLMVGEPGHGHGHEEALAWAQGRLRSAGFDPQARILPGTPDVVIAREVAAHGIGLLVMGAYGHSRIRSLIVGSTTTQLLRSCAVPVLLLR